MRSKRTQILDLLSTHTVSQITSLVKCSSDYVYKTAKSENRTWISDPLNNKEVKILSLAKDLTVEDIAAAVGCSLCYVFKVFKQHEIKGKREESKKELAIKMADEFTVYEIAEKLELHARTVKKYFYRENISYKGKIKTLRENVLELADNHTAAEIISKTKISRDYVLSILRKAGFEIPKVVKEKKVKKVKKPKVIEVKPRNVAKTSKTISSKIKVGQSDMQKGNTKLTAKEKVMPTLVRDESKVRTVVLDSKTTKLLYPGQAGYDTPIEVLRSEWEKKQEEGLRQLKGA